MYRQRARSVELAFRWHAVEKPNSWKDEPMPTESSVQFFIDWAKERTDEMDATVASLKLKAAEMQVEPRGQVNQLIANLHKMRDEFEHSVKKQAEAGEAAWEA